MADMADIGEIRTNPNNPNQRARWDGRQWADASTGGAGIPPGSTAAPEYGAGAYKTPDGAVLRGKQIIRGANTAPAESRVRIGLSLGPAIEAQQRMFATEGWNNPKTPNNPLGKNPYNSGRGLAARMIDGSETGGPIAKAIGGADYQAYEQAARTFESGLLPIFSGAAVTPTEATRFIRANLPQMGDSPRILAAKARNRAMLLNAAAQLTNQPIPFPRVGIWGGATGDAGKKASPATRSAPAPSGNDPLGIRGR